jgi:hypothetical protein
MHPHSGAAGITIGNSMQTLWKAWPQLAISRRAVDIARGIYSSFMSKGTVVTDLPKISPEQLMEHYSATMRELKSVREELIAVRRQLIVTTAEIDVANIKGKLFEELKQMLHDDASAAREQVAQENSSLSKAKSEYWKSRNDFNEMANALKRLSGSGPIDLLSLVEGGDQESQQPANNPCPGCFTAKD